jgi:hypothetical protein
MFPLRPSDFLTPLADNEIPDIPPEEESHFTRRYHHLQRLQNQLWNRFVTEYLPTLQESQKWTRVLEPLQIGDVGFLLEKNERGKYPLAVIRNILSTNSDGVVRKVEVQVAGKLYTRHARNFCKLQLRP